MHNKQQMTETLIIPRWFHALLVRIRVNLFVAAFMLGAACVSVGLSFYHFKIFAELKFRRCVCVCFFDGVRFLSV